MNPTDPAPGLERHEGVLRVESDPRHSAVEIEFDPSVLSDHEVRDLLKAHINRMESSIRKQTYQLVGNACESCALKLERRVASLPGVRRACATYLGQVLSVTFDSAVSDTPAMEESLRRSGADIRPLETRAPERRSFATKLRAGDLNEEVSCALGFASLVAGFIVSKTAGTGIASHLLYAGAYLFAGQQGVRSALASLKERELDIDVLMVLAALGAAAIGAPFEGALLLFLFSFSNVLQRHAMGRTQEAIRSLLKLRPNEALVKRSTGTAMVAVEGIRIGETVVVRPGEQIPTDGELIEGDTHVDESSLTGESMPVAKTAGAPVFAGTLNQSGGIEIRVTRRADDSTLARMVKLVAEAQAEKSNTQRFLESAEKWYAMGVIALTILVLLVPWLLRGEEFSRAFYRAMTVMVVASPCALVISTPATVLSAIGGAARKGILIKGGSHLDRAATIDIVALDKTGTLTFGKPSLTDIVSREGIHRPDAALPPSVRLLLRDAAALEAKSEHPLAHAVVSAADQLGLEPPEPAAFQSSAGRGAEATVNGVRHLIGSERWFREVAAEGMDALARSSSQLQDDGKTCVWFGRRDGDRVSAELVLAMADTIRPGSAGLVQALKNAGVRRVVMLTGDEPRVAGAIARETGIDEVHASLLPEDKLRVIRRLKSEGRVLMAGDGVNDAPALAASDIGLAMGAAGTDVAMETADIVLMGDRVETIPLLLDHARRARRVLVQNLVFATGVIVVLVLAALGFSLPLPLGVVGHEGSTVLVCLNGLRLLWFRMPA